MMSRRRKRIGVFIAHNDRESSTLGRYLDRRGVGYSSIQYPEAGLVYYVLEFEDSDLLSRVFRKGRFSFGDITGEVENATKAVAYVEAQRDYSRQNLRKSGYRKKEIIEKTNAAILRGIELQLD
jgi:hypothetical protein